MSAGTSTTVCRNQKQWQAAARTVIAGGDVFSLRNLFNELWQSCDTPREKKRLTRGYLRLGPENHCETLLHVAAKNDKSNVIDFLSESLGDHEFSKLVERRENGGHTPLHLAAAAGALLSLRALVAYGADVNARILATSACSAHPLLDESESDRDGDECGPNTDTRKPMMRGAIAAGVLGSEGGTDSALHRAAACGSLPVVSALLELGADPLSKGVDGGTPFHNAASFVTRPAWHVHQLQPHQRRQHAQGGRRAETGVWQTPQHGVPRGGAGGGARLFFSPDAAVDGSNVDTDTSVQILRELVASATVRSGLNTNKKRSEKEKSSPQGAKGEEKGRGAEKSTCCVKQDSSSRAISSSLFPPSLSLTNPLRVLSAVVDTADSDGDTPLLKAACSGNVPAITVLVEELGASLATRNLRGLTPLHAAAANGHVRAVKALLSLGADIEARDLFGRTPLYFSVQQLGYHAQMFTVLIETFGADVNTRLYSGGGTLFDFARKSGLWALAGELLAVGADDRLSF